MARTNIQVPVTTTLKQKAAARAEKLGFSSIQDVIRVFLTGFVEEKYSIGIREEEKVEYLTDREAEVLERKFRELKEEEKKGNLLIANSVDEFLKQLDSDD